MFANLLLTPFVLAAMVFLYLSWSVDAAYAPWIIPFLLIAALIFILKPQIDWWWYSRRPPVLDPKLEAVLERVCGFYKRLDAEGKQKFRERVGLFNLGTDWMPKGWPEDRLPQDIQLALATQAVMLTFNKPRFLFDKFEKVIVYPRPFPSPEYQFAHASELFEPDGCLLFSGDQVLKAFIQPGAMYQVGLHEYARAYVLSNPGENYPTFEGEDVWQKLEQVSRMPRGHVESVIGLAGVEALPVAIHHYYMFPELFKQVFSKENAALDLVFG
jgi:Glucose-regulated metallo-peptidase M90